VPDATSGTLTFTVQRNDAATPMTCSITATAPALTARTCADTTDIVSFAAGDRISVEVQNGTRGYVKYVRWTARYQ
jgi:uncharacterized membrane protein